MIAKIVKEPDPILHRSAKQVKTITPDIENLVGVMIRTMHAARGVGLAANQIGSEWAILVANPDGERGNEIVLINPVIEKRSGKTSSPEGCLSLPGISSEVTRAAQVTVSGLNREGKPVTLEAVQLLAKILQHETDHLGGRLFVDRVSPWKKLKLLKEYESVARTLRQIKL